MNWLYNFPNVVILIVFLATMFITKTVIHRIIHHYVRDQVSDTLARDLHARVVILISLVMAFSLGQALESTRTLSKAVSDEASQIHNLNKLLIHYGSPAAEAIRPALHAYVKSIVDDEWPNLNERGLSKVTAEKFQAVSRGVIQLKPQGDRETALYLSALNLTDRIGHARELRIATADAKLPSVYWYVILIGLLAELIISALLERGKYSALIINLLSTVLSGILALVFIFDQPYHGEAGIDPGPLKRLAKVMNENSTVLAPQRLGAYRP